MAFNKMKHLEKIVSVFVLVTILIILSSLLLIGSFGKWFASKRYYYAYLPSASGLDKNISIRLKGVGFEIGALEDFNLTNDNRVLLKISVFTKYISRVRRDSVLYLKKPTIGLLGKSYMEISTGSANMAELPANSFIPTYKTFEGRLLIASKRMLGETDEGDSDLNLPTPIKNFLSRVNFLLDPDKPYMRNIEEILFRIKGILTTVDKYGMLSVIGSRGFQHNVETMASSLNQFASRHVREIMDKVVSVMTTVESTANTVVGVRLPRIMQNLENVLVRAEAVLRNIERSPIFGGRGRAEARGGNRVQSRRRRGSILLE